MHEPVPRSFTGAVSTPSNGDNLEKCLANIIKRFTQVKKQCPRPLVVLKIKKRRQLGRSRFYCCLSVIRFVLYDLSESDGAAWSEILNALLTRYDSRLKTSFPYLMGCHGESSGQSDYSHLQLRAHSYRQLLRSATVKNSLPTTKCWPREVSASHFLEEFISPVDNQRAGVALTSEEAALSPLAFNAITSK
jgi:Galactose-1-phosphate uridyl transferase, C-terminal domain